MNNKLLSLLHRDSEKPEKIEELLNKLAKEEPAVFNYLQKKLELQSRRLGAEAYCAWFDLLAWWFARLLMYGCVAAGLIFAWVYGQTAVDPLTWGLCGAAVYYMLIQIFTPHRLRRDAVILCDNAGEKEILGNMLQSDKN